MMSGLDHVKTILQSHGLRVTKSRLAVATILIQNKSSLLTSVEIFKRITKAKKLNCDQVSVYRILSTFEQLGIARKNVFQGEAARYTFNEPSYGVIYHRHEHFFKCDQCGIIEPFEGCLVSKKERELEKNGYRELNHHLEITGLCPKCA